MISIRDIVLALHIISAGIWIAQLAAEFAFRSVMRGSQGKPIELPLLMARVRVVNFMGQAGGIGILLTGFALLWTDNLTFLSIGGFTPTWLLIKQFVYLLAMGIAFLFIIPTQRKLVPQFIEAARGTPHVTPEIRRLCAQMTNASRLINVLLLVNIVLAVWKPQ